MQKDAIMALAVPLAVELGLEVLEIEIGGDASRRIVRILLDAERPVTVTDCETVSHRLNDVLDANAGAANTTHTIAAARAARTADDSEAPHNRAAP